MTKLFTFQSWDIHNNMLACLVCSTIYALRNMLGGGHKTFLWRKRNAMVLGLALWRGEADWTDPVFTCGPDIATPASAVPNSNLKKTSSFFKVMLQCVPVFLFYFRQCA